MTAEADNKGNNKPNTQPNNNRNKGKNRAAKIDLKEKDQCEDIEKRKQGPKRH